MKHHRCQKIEEGFGSAFHRIYSITIPVPLNQAVQTMQSLQAEPNDFSPQILARFEKIKGLPAQMQMGDEFHIHITGPWNGPVRVTKVTKKCFHFVTLEGHLEAGEIRFELIPNGDEETRFEIESLARSKDGLVDFVYDKVPIARMAQTTMWISFCKHFAQKALLQAGKSSAACDSVDILTERCDQETGEWQTI